MTQNSFRKYLSMPGMLSEVRECFDSIPDPVVSRGITLSGCLMTALGVFSLKMTSLLSLGFIFESAPKYDWSLISTLYQ